MLLKLQKCHLYSYINPPIYKIIKRSILSRQFPYPNTKVHLKKSEYQISLTPPNTPTPDTLSKIITPPTHRHNIYYTLCTSHYLTFRTPPKSWFQKILIHTFCLMNPNQPYSKYLRIRNHRALLKKIWKNVNSTPRVDPLPSGCEWSEVKWMSDSESFYDLAKNWAAISLWIGANCYKRIS